MPVETLDFAEPFFRVQHITDEDGISVEGRAIVLNLGGRDLSVEDQTVAPLSSVIVQASILNNVERAVIIRDFDAHGDDDALFAKAKATWPSAFDIRQEERLRGVSHYMSPKVFVGNVGLTMYHSGSVPLNVGLHKDHPFCPVPGFREVHTQIVGFGKMQQCRERDVETLYLEEFMAPGTTHKPMYDTEGNYPWHQYETITPSIFMAVEILPEGALVPEMEVQNG
ncbi:hypothetical protein [Ruegeria conchae]|uniref:Uncharacterized protein n=1 Tax=Ruegeria conchae TaxID=981384 RepID=A0A497Z8I5_9RHOB|nr:hypothetical protein [Ruegeria conchae]RLK02855.1 hypothetical protein CLV75_3413 [Ruegeria conchae]